MSNQELERIIREIAREVVNKKLKTTGASGAVSEEADGGTVTADLSALCLQESMFVDAPLHEEWYMDLKRSTPARLGAGRAGPRPHISSLLRFRADHAAAMDAVFGDVKEELIEEWNLISIKTQARDKAEFLSNPAVARQLDDDNKKLLMERHKPGAQVQVLVADGLSSIAVEANLPDLLPSLLQGLSSRALTVGIPVFIKYGRVGSMDVITELLKPQVTILLIGERPGLVTNESLSCYMTYEGYVGIPENDRTVISNIYSEGTLPVEAGAHIAEVAAEMIKNKSNIKNISH